MVLSKSSKRGEIIINNISNCYLTSKSFLLGTVRIQFVLEITFLLKIKKLLEIIVKNILEIHSHEKMSVSVLF